jgi:hypothetical protein
MTKERQRAGGRRQKGENAIFALCQKGHKPRSADAHGTPKFIYEQKLKMYFEARSAKNTMSLLNPRSADAHGTPKFIYGDFLLPSALCPLPS